MKGARLAGVLLAVAGVAVGLEASTFNVSFMTDPIGPKALPYLVGLILFVGGTHAAVRPPSEVEWPDRAMGVKLAAACAAFFLYPLALEILGFVASTTLVVGALSHLYGAPPKRGLPAAAVLSVALWLLFVRALALPLPVGSLWTR